MEDCLTSQGQASKQYHMGLGVKSQAWCQGIAVVAEPTRCVVSGFSDFQSINLFMLTSFSLWPGDDAAVLP